MARSVWSKMTVLAIIMMHSSQMYTDGYKPIIFVFSTYVGLGPGGEKKHISFLFEHNGVKVKGKVNLSFNQRDLKLRTKI